MSENEHVWDEVQRVAVSRFSGASVDDDDVMRQVDLMEAALNPNRQGAGGGMGGGGMMPPMMMGGMGAGGGGSASGGGGGGGLGGGIGAGITPAPNMPQASAGIGIGVSASQAPVAEPTDELEAPEMGGIGGGMGGGPGGGLGDDDTARLPGEEAGGAQPGVAGPPADGFSADPEAVRGLATRWAEVAQELQGLNVPILDTGLGIVHPAERPQQAVNQQLVAWTGSATAEFEAMASRLQDVAGQYEAVEDEGIGAIKKETVDG